MDKRSLWTSPPAIRLVDLQFSYPPVVAGGSPVDVLQGITLDVPRGQALAVTGPTSSGKSTLALVLAALVPEMTGGTLHGQVWVDGLDAVHTPASQLSTRVGLVFQEPERQLFNMTVADEVAFGLEGLALPPHEIRARMVWALDRVGLAGLEERAPWQLSGGQQKRLALAAILALQPPILVLDEPMAGLDPVGRREVAKVLQELRSLVGATILVFEKNAEFVARWAERVVVLADGKVALDGSPEAVFQEVDRLHTLGVGVPQIGELAAKLRAHGEAVTCLTARQAADTLKPQVAAGLVLGELPVVATSAPAAPLAVAVQGVSFAYPSGTKALDNLSLAVPQGQLLVLVGQNGSGKSTLARQLNGLLRPQVGSVAIQGRSTADRPVGDLAREVGYVFQNPDHQIYAASVREEVMFGPRNLGMAQDNLARCVDEALSSFNLTEQAETPPAVLGYGQRRRVTLASVWAMQPPIWVLDEPTTGLDARDTADLMARLRELHRLGRTVILITHDLQLAAEHAERIVVLHEGRVAMDGAPAAVLADESRLAAYGLRPPPITRLSGLLAPCGFPHPMLTVEQFVRNWRMRNDE